MKKTTKKILYGVIALAGLTTAGVRRAVGCKLRPAGAYAQRRVGGAGGNQRRQPVFAVKKGGECV